MKESSLLLLVTGEVRKENVEQYGLYQDMFYQLFAPHRERLVHIDCVDARTDAKYSLSDYDAYLITGSRCGAYENHDWLVPLVDNLHKLRAMRKKLIGVCFGHQLLAHSFGGRVVQSTKGWGLGVHSWQFTPSATNKKWLTNNGLKEYNLCSVHKDQVIQLPEDFQQLAHSEFCEYAMICDKENSIIGVQGHPEFSIDYARLLYNLHKHELTDQHIEQIENSFRTVSHQGELVAQWIMNFIEDR